MTGVIVSRRADKRSDEAKRLKDIGSIVQATRVAVKRTPSVRSATIRGRAACYRPS